MTETAYRAILFADISGSTALYDRLGNETPLQLVTRTLNMLTQCMAEQQGELIKTIGDEILCIFPDTAAAIRAASAMQNMVEKTAGRLPSGLYPHQRALRRDNPRRQRYMAMR